MNKNRIIKYLFLGIFFLLMAFNKHPYYVSVTDIEHNAKEQELEICVKIFTDDFEKTLKEAYKTKVDIYNPPDVNKLKFWIQDYISKHLKLKADSKTLALEFIGYEIKEEAVYSYFQTSKIASVKKIEAENDLLYEYRKEQMGMMHVIVNANRKSTRLVNPEKSAVFEF